MSYDLAKLCLIPLLDPKVSKGLAGPIGFPLKITIGCQQFPLIGYSKLTSTEPLGCSVMRSQSLLGENINCMHPYGWISSFPLHTLHEKSSGHEVSQFRSISV